MRAAQPYLDRGGRAGLIVQPTGAGKSVLLAELCRRQLSSQPGSRVGVFTHVKELIEQDHGELIRLWPDTPAGILCAGLGRLDTDAEILSAGVHSAYRSVADLDRFDLALVDEAHLIGRRSGTMYGRLLDGIREVHPELPLIGLTATPFRLDSGRLDQGKGALFDTVIHEVPVTELIDDGFLVRPIAYGTATQIDTSVDGIRAGEFIAGELKARRCGARSLPALRGAGPAWRGSQEMVGLRVVDPPRRRDRDGARAARHHRQAGFERDAGRRTQDDDCRLSGWGDPVADFGQHLGTGFNVPDVDPVALMRPTWSPAL